MPLGPRGSMIWGAHPSPHPSQSCSEGKPFFFPEGRSSKCSRPSFGILFPTPLPLPPTSPLPSTLSLPPLGPSPSQSPGPLCAVSPDSFPAWPLPPLLHHSFAPTPTPLCLKFWRDLSTNGEVSPLGHRSALIRFGKASSLPPPCPTPAGADRSGAGQKALTPLPPFPLSARVGGRGKKEGRRRTAKTEGGNRTFQSPLIPIPNWVS